MAPATEVTLKQDGDSDPLGELMEKFPKKLNPVPL
jgi:hypothetical protein